MSDDNWRYLAYIIQKLGILLCIVLVGVIINALVGVVQ